MNTSINNSLFNVDEVVALVRNNNTANSTNNQVQPTKSLTKREDAIERFKAIYGDHIKVVKCKFGSKGKLDRLAQELSTRGVDIKSIPLKNIMAAPTVAKDRMVFPDWDRIPQTVEGTLLATEEIGNYSYLITSI